MMTVALVSFWRVSAAQALILIFFQFFFLSHFFSLFAFLSVEIRRNVVQVRWDDIPSINCLTNELENNQVGELKRIFLNWILEKLVQKAYSLWCKYS